MRFSSIAVLVLGLATGCAAQSRAKWDYYGKTGPLAWGRLDPAYQACSKGHEQSPIDIRGAHLNKTLQPIEFHYMSRSGLPLENNGAHDHRSRQSGRLHRRWRRALRPSAVRIPPSQRKRSERQADRSRTLNSCTRAPTAKWSIIEVRMAMDRGSPNAVLAMLGHICPRSPAPPRKSPTWSMPAGSCPPIAATGPIWARCSTPPCTEGVRWFVFENEISLSLDQVRAFTMLFRMNSRPVQDAHGRRIEANE